jgi:hypothetical protein
MIFEFASLFMYRCAFPVRLLVFSSVLRLTCHGFARLLRFWHVYISCHDLLAYFASHVLLHAVNSKEVAVLE